MIKALRLILPAIISFTFLPALHAQSFTPGNIAVFIASSSTNNTTGSIIELNTTTPNQSAVNTYLINGTTGVDALRFSGSASSTAYLANSDDGSLLCFTGHNTTTTSGNINVIAPRGVGTYNAAGTFALATTYTGVTSGQQTRAATSLNNSTWYIGDQNGLYTNGTSSPSPSGNLRGVKSFGGTVYVGQQNSSAATIQVSTISAATGGTITGLNGLTNNNNFQDFYLISSGTNGSTYDLLYVISNTSATAGTITKFSLISGTWTDNGSYTTSFGGFGIAAKKAGSGAEIFVSTGNGATGANNVIKCTDDAGFNTAINITTANNVTLYTAATGITIKGVAFAPVAPPVPVVNLSVSTNTASEADATVVTVTATASSPVTGDQTVSLNVSGTGITAGDYSLSSATITIPNGSTTGSATFTIVDDPDAEGPETATLTISDPSVGITLGATVSQNIAITDNDAIPGIMRITEYMYGGADGEFVEFTNTGNTAVDMTGYSFDDDSGIPGTVSLSAFGIVQPGESVILTESNASDFRSAWHLCNGIKIIGNLTTNLGRNDEINLFDASDNLVDKLAFGDQTFAGTIRTQNISGWVNAAGLGANIIADWSLSSVADAEGSFTSTGGDIGSPGKSTRAIVAYDPCIVIPGAPTIVIDVTATSNYLDAGTITSPSSPYAISGVINDPVDPASSLGIDFTIGDDVTPAGSLTVTVASSNTTVVPSANLTLSGSGASKNLKIVPAAAGYSTITVTVSDGTYNTSYVLSYAASQNITNVSNWPTGIADASAAIALDNDYMVIANDESNLLYVYSRTNSGLPVKTFDFNFNNILGLTDGSTNNWKEVDVEASTNSTTQPGRSYWLGSMSNSSSFNDKPNRNRIIAIDITGTGAATTFSNAGYYAGLRSQLITWGDAHGYNFSASAADGVDPKTIDGFNAEGLVFGPDNTTLYIGFRAPLVPTGTRTKAVIAPIQNFETWFNNGAPAGSPVIGAPIELDLGLRGIRDIIRLSNGNYVIVAGSYDGTLIPALFRWTGNPSDAPVAMTSFDLTGLNAEAVMPVIEGGQPSLDKLQIICDDGDNIFYNDGMAAKDLSQDNFKKFSSTIVLSSIPGVLPVHYEYFTAQRHTNDVSLNWKNATPDDVVSFDIMRSENGTDFTRIQTIAAVPNQYVYSFTDMNAPAKRLYYRIAAKDMAGQSYSSTIRMVTKDGSNEPVVKVYPNPVSTDIFTIIINETGTKKAAVYNSAGMLYKQFSFGQTAMDVSTAGWPKGFYLLRLTTESGMVTEKIVIQ